MGTVFLHNASFRSRKEALLAFDQPKAVLRNETYWNIWKRHAVGAALEESSVVLLVASWTERGKRVRHVMWKAQAWDVAKWDVPDWDAAVRRIGRWSGYGVREVRASPYTWDKRNLAGPLFVLAWRAQPVQWIDAPLPARVRIGRNGWSAFDSAEVRSWGLGLISEGKGNSPNPTSRKRVSGQGRRLDVAARDAVEERAMEVAKSWLREEGWTDITDTSRTSSWDYEALDHNGERCFIEVKGSTTLGDSFEVTSGEVNAARQHGDTHLMVTVDSITLSYDQDGSVRAAGGEIRVFDPWLPSKTELRETRYVWVPSASRLEN